MRWVPHAALRPHHCAAIPFVGNSNAKGGFIDTGVDLPGWDPHVYVSVDAVQEMARMIGWQPSHVQQGVRDRLAEKDAEIEQLRSCVAERDQQLEAVQVLKNAGFSQAKPPGRPRKAAA
jgi:hypothetical protein